MQLPRWQWLSEHVSPSEQIVTVYEDQVGGGARIETRLPNGRREIEWTLPDGSMAHSEAEYIEKMQIVRP